MEHIHFKQTLKGDENTVRSLVLQNKFSDGTYTHTKKRKGKPFC